YALITILYQVDIAMECARLQHRLSLPPLKAQDVHHDAVTNYVELKNIPQSSTGPPIGSQQDIPHEILSIGSQDFINQDAWGGSYAEINNDFTFMPNNDMNQMQGSGSFRFVGDDLNTRSIEIDDADGQMKTDPIVENLRWVGMSNKDLEMAFFDDHMSVPLEKISCFGNEKHGVQGTTGENSHKNTDHFELFNLSNDFLDVEGDLDDYSTTQIVEMYQKTEVSHGLLVSTRQVSNTFFHQIVPSETVRVQLNPGKTITCETQLAKRLGFEKFKAFMSSKRLETTSPIVNLVSLLLICCIYLGSKSIPDDGNCAVYRDGDGKNKNIEKNNAEEYKGKWSVSNLVIEKVIWPCVTLALAFSTICEHHNSLPNFS
ncbi:NAC domain-containing protein 54-like, partial [Bidens hawaiensis]|uniref:NAC domain-containing protein 54-like n=1 Tax=Bidens hawaiensis TaxID=980011 RepID=UPI00404ADD2C